MERIKGNPIASLRFRWQVYLKDTDEPCDSEWSQLKNDAIRLACRDLIRNFEKFGKDDIVIKIFNEMNYKQKPMVITLDYARRYLGKQIQMEGAQRFIYLRGYVTEVEVLGLGKEKPYWECITDRGERIQAHEDDFYHRDPGGVLVGRGVEFKRKYPDHDVRIENLPSI